MKKKFLLSCVKVALFAAVASVPLLVSCAGDAGGAAGAAADSGAGVDAASDLAPDAAGPDSGGKDPFANAAFSIDTSIVPAGVAPVGCVGAFESTTGRLSIGLDSKVSVLLLAVVGGEIAANGVVCTDARGVKATAENTSRIQIDGSVGNETVILDLSTGSFGTTILSKNGGIYVDLAGGDDTVLIRGTDQKDTVRVGKAGSSTAVDVTADSAGSVRITGVEKLVCSLGPGADEFRGGKDTGFDTATDLSLTVFGDADDDTIEGGSKDDELNGGEGDDLFDEGEAGNGSDTINGGLGKNTISYERRTAAVTATLCNSGVVKGCVSLSCACDADDGQAGEKDNLVNVSHIVGGAGGDNLTGTSSDDWIEGRNGDDYLYGMEGNDVLSGGPGEDTLEGGPGVDSLDCGDGDSDIAVVDASDNVNNCELF